MTEYLPLLIVGAMIGMLATAFLVAYALEKNKKESMGFDRNMSDGVIIRRLFAYAGPYWKSFALAVLMMVFSVAYDVTAPLLVGNITGLIQADFALPQLFGRVAVYASILVVSQICNYLQAMLLQKTGQKILSKIREDVFRHAQSLSAQQLNNIPVGTLVTRVSNTGKKYDGGAGGTGGNAGAQLCAGADRPVLCTFCGAVYYDVPEILPKSPPSGEQCHHSGQYLPFGKPVGNEDHSDL